jgi:hypothetical protein
MEFRVADNPDKARYELTADGEAAGWLTGRRAEFGL